MDFLFLNSPGKDRLFLGLQNPDTVVLRVFKTPILLWVLCAV